MAALVTALTLLLTLAPFAHAQEPQLAAGVTTQQQMVDSFGEPETVINEPDGGQAWVYTNIEIHVIEPTLSLGGPQPHEEAKWLLRFNKHGVLIEHKLVFADGSWVGFADGSLVGETPQKGGCVPHVDAGCG